MEKFSKEEYIDILKEIGNIGAGNATTALSFMIDSRIDLSVPKAEVIDFNKLMDITGGAEQVVAGIYIDISRDIEGVMLFMVSCETARILVDSVMHNDPKDQVTNFMFNEIELSAFTEIGNIITGAYLSSISSLLGFTIIPSVPYMTIDMAGAILSVPAIEFSKKSDTAILIESEFKINNKKMDGYFVLIPTEESYYKIIEKLGVLMKP
ncbi:MAG: chemotaxis protein CheC [Lachnospiraceae bacterium]|nr:chemotaxis protein CheC [Lachnospiraceae bacterium]